MFCKLFDFVCLSVSVCLCVLFQVTLHGIINFRFVHWFFVFLFFLFRFVLFLCVREELSTSRGGGYVCACVCMCVYT